MSKKVIVSLFACLFLLALPVVAQDEEPGTIGRLIFAEAKPGSESQFEEGIKKHMAFHGGKSDPWSWTAWQVIAGEDNGEYLFGTFYHHWADFDNEPVSGPEDDADIAANIAPHSGEVTIEYLSAMPKHSRPPESTTPAAMLQVIDVYLKPDKVETYLNAISKIPEALEKANSPIRYYFGSYAVGARHPSFYIAFPRAKFADFKSPEKAFRDVLEEAYGPAEAESILHALSGSSRGSESRLLRYRPDLSYTPSEE